MRSITIGPIQSAHDLNGYATNFAVRVYVQSAEGNFLYGTPTQHEIDEGTIKFKQSQDGKAVTDVSANNEQLTNHFLVLKTENGKNINAQIWADKLQQTVKSVPNVDKKEGSYKFSMILCIVIVIAVLFFVLSKKK